MFDQLKSFGAIAALVKDRERLRAAGERVNERLARARVEGSASGGLVRVVCDGQLHVLEVRIDPAALGALAGSLTIIEPLIAEASNDALARARALARETLEHEAREMGLGDLIPSLGSLPL